VFIIWGRWVLGAREERRAAVHLEWAPAVERASALRPARSV